MFVAMFVFLSMLFLHIIDDFVLQGKLSNMKQKSWWLENAKYSSYVNDYKICLWLHAFEWCFMVHTPLAIYYLVYRVEDSLLFLVSMIVNTLIHCKIDDMKCNKYKFTVTDDQLIHGLQISITWIVFFFTVMKK